MDAAEIVIHELDRQRMDMIFDFLGEGIGKASQSAALHP